MKRFSRPSPAMVVAIISLIVAIGGTAVALPGKRTVTNRDLKNGAVGARSIGRTIVGFRAGLSSIDQVADDGIFTEMEGTIRCPSSAPLAFDPSIGNMGPKAYELRQNAISNRFGGPGGYRFIVSADEGPDLAYTMTVNCLPRR